MINFAIGSLTLVSNSTATTGFILQTPIEGLESPNYRNNSFSNPGRHGVTVSSQFYDARIINLTGIVYAPNATLFEQYRQQLSQAVQIKRDANGYPLPARVTFTTMAGNNYFIDVYFDKPTFNFDMPNNSQFQITGTVANPFIFGAALQGTGNIYQPTAGGRVTPTITPYTTTSSVGGSVAVNNPGDETAFPIIYVYGSVTNPIITNVTTGKVMRLTYTVAAGNTLSIDMYNQTIVLNNSSSQISSKSIDSDWWGIAPGINVISLATGSTSDTGYISGAYYPPYVGV